MSETTDFLRAFLLRCAVAGVGSLALAGRVLADDDDDDDDFDPLPGRTEDQIDALFLNFDEVVETIALYAALSATLLILLVLSLSLRLRRWASYVALTIISMLWLAFFEQYATGLFWIGLDVGYGALALAGLALAGLHFALAGTSILPGQPLHQMRYVLFGMAAAMLGLIGWSLLKSPIDLPLLYLTIAIVACLSHIAAIPSFRRLQGPTALVSRNGFALVMTLGIAGIAALLFGEIDEDFDLIFTARIALLAVVFFFALFFVRYVLSILFERDANAKRALADAKRDAEKTKALFEAEKKYSRARETSRLHTLRLAAASHDIRQPIASLRTTMDAVAKDHGPETRAQLAAAFDYLDGLAQSYLDTGEAENAPLRPADTSDDGREDVATTMICATLDRMFRKEAEAKGLSFDARAQDATLHVQPLAVTRILSNLLSNAIKHTADGSVSLTGEAVADGYRFLVHNSADLPDDIDKAALFEPFVKGASSAGSGLGLSIIETLARTHGLRASWSDEMGSGTTFALHVPRPS